MAALRDCYGKPNFESETGFATICRAVADEFPNKCTATELKTQWADMEQRYGCAGTSRVATEAVGDLDGPQAESVSRQKTMHSFESLFCRRCYVYDCPLHGLPSVGFPRKRKPPANPDVDEFDAMLHKKLACGPKCYMLSTAVPQIKNKSPSVEVRSKIDSLAIDVEQLPSSPSSSKWKQHTRQPKAKKSIQASHSLSRSISTWRPAEESLFRVLQGSFGTDYCSMAASGMLESKSCRQIWFFAQNEGPPSPLQTSPLSPKLTNSRKKGVVDQHRYFRKMKWASNTGGVGLVHNEDPFSPCVHEGVPCGKEVDDCCAKLGNLCMKFCRCSLNCKNRFPGCRCTKGCNTRQCPCYHAQWECDPDLCNSCGAGDLSGEPIQCTNVGIQRKQCKHLRVGESDVAGWGCFAMEEISRNDFISEYMGEIITQQEADRRGALYDKKGLNYIFGLNKEYCVDAYRIGNKIRFANHSTAPNCHARVMFVLGDHRIGLYAKRDIKAGEELFFNYEHNSHFFKKKI